MKEEIIILGVGNLLLKDEGIGIHVIKEMEKIKLPPQVKLVDGATAGLGLLALIDKAKKIIIVDCVKGEEEPGTLYRLVPQELEISKELKRFSLHDISVLEVLAVGRQLGASPEVVIIGVEPKEINWGLEPTSEIKEKIPKIIEAVLKEI